MRLAARWPVGFVDQTATCIRVHERNMSADPSYMERAMLAGVRHALADPVVAARARGREQFIRACMYVTIALNAYAQRPPRAGPAVAAARPGAAGRLQVFDARFCGAVARAVAGPTLTEQDAACRPCRELDPVRAQSVPARGPGRQSLPVRDDAPPRRRADTRSRSPRRGCTRIFHALAERRLPPVPGLRDRTRRSATSRICVGATRRCPRASDARRWPSPARTMRRWRSAGRASCRSTPLVFLFHSEFYSEWVHAARRSRAACCGATWPPSSGVSLR